MITIEDMRQSMNVLWRQITEQQMRVLEMEMTGCKFNDIEEIREKTRQAQAEYFKMKRELKQLARNKNKFSKN